MSGKQKSREKLDEIFEEFSDLTPTSLYDLANGTLSDVTDELLHKIDERMSQLVTDDMETVEIVGYLSVTNQVWDLIPSRKDYVLRSLRTLASRGKLVRGLVWNLVPEYPEYNTHTPAEWKEPEEK